MSARRWWAWPLVPVYGTALMVKETLRRMGSSPEKNLAWRVISVGSLSAGGAGKTPVVIALAKLLSKSGRRVDVLSRGYGREGVAIECVDLQKPDAAKLFGDEPVLIAQATGVPVWVGADRFAAGQMAEAAVVRGGDAGSSAALRNDNSEKRNDDSKNIGVHLLDDGFQHRRLKRDLDMVLVTAEDLEDVLLPVGNRREPLDALGRADIIVLREEERSEIEPAVTALMPQGALLWSVRRRLRFPAPLGVLSAGLRPLAFCAIARPEGFAKMLQRAGCGIIDTVIFSDHHAYTMSDVEQIIELAKRLNASGFVTTEKDAVKLTSRHLKQLEELGPVIAVALDVVFVNEDAVIDILGERLA